MNAYLRNEDRTWEIPEGESLVGSGSECVIMLDKALYPTISRNHAKLILRDGMVSFRDVNSANGTLKNGVRLSAGELRAGDTLELGAGGPVFEIRRPASTNPDMTTRVSSRPVERAPAAPGYRPTAPTPSVPATAPQAGQAGATRMMPPAADPSMSGSVTRIHPASQPSAANDMKTVVVARGGTGAQTAQTARPAVQETMAEEPEEMFVPAPLPLRPSTPEPDRTLEYALMRKLATMQKMLGAVLAAAVILVGLLLYQDREIQANKDAIVSLQQQASSSVGLLMPQLDERMKRLDTRLDALDPKLAKAEDHMSERMNQEVPKMMDKYLNQRMSTMKAEHPEMLHPKP